MVCTTCMSCGGMLHWDWSEAFAKFGFNDGDGQIETWRVEDALIDAGYAVTVDRWGVHNTLITSVKRHGVELIPFDDPDYSFGYDDPREFLPGELVSLLEEEFPQTASVFRFSKAVVPEPGDNAPVIDMDG